MQRITKKTAPLGRSNLHLVNHFRLTKKNDDHRTVCLSRVCVFWKNLRKFCSNSEDTWLNLHLLLQNTLSSFFNIERIELVLKHTHFIDLIVDIASKKLMCKFADDLEVLFLSLRRKESSSSDLETLEDIGGCASPMLCFVLSSQEVIDLNPTLVCYPKEFRFTKCSHS